MLLHCASVTSPADRAGRRKCVLVDSVLAVGIPTGAAACWVGRSPCEPDDPHPAASAAAFHACPGAEGVFQKRPPRKAWSRLLDCYQKAVGGREGIGLAGYTVRLADGERRRGYPVADFTYILGDVLCDCAEHDPDRDLKRRAGRHLQHLARRGKTEWEGLAALAYYHCYERAPHYWGLEVRRPAVAGAELWRTRQDAR